ncbi:MAG TPA: hypothetical protein VIK04_11530 [Solirubrobacteraceae bacterium]
MDGTNGHDPEPTAATPPGEPAMTAPTPAPIVAPSTPEPAPTAPTGPVAPAPPVSPAWADRLATAAAAAHAWLLRPRVRLSVTGGLLLMIGVLLMANSVWTLPLVIAGALMVVIAWIGHRLEGRFAVQWGDAGTQLAFRATIKPAGHAPEGVRAAVAPVSHHLPAADELDDIIEGEAHTVEIDVTELRALIAAAESAEARSPATQAAVQDIRIRRTPASHAVGRE